ncbi:MAG: hypothetical protein ACRCW4_18160 [Candidatus Neomicrothrix subdominans]|jgi:hypothetical protein
MKSEAERRAEELLRNIGEAAPPVKEDTWTDIVARVDEVGPAPAAVATGRRRMVPMSVAAGLLIVAVATGMFLAGGDNSSDGDVRVASRSELDSGSTTSNQPAAPPASEASEIKQRYNELQARKNQACEELLTAGTNEASATDLNPWPDPVLEGPVAVESFDCQVAYVDGAALFGRDDRSPIPATTENGDLVGYWIPAVGMLPPEIVNDPEFDMEAWQKAGQQYSDGLLDSALNPAADDEYEQPAG